MNIGQDTTHNLPFQNGNSYNFISQIDDTLKCRPVQRYRERERFIFTYKRTCIHVCQIKDAAALKQIVIESVIPLSYFKDD